MADTSSLPKVVDKSLDDILTLKLKKRDLIVIFNILVSQHYSLADAPIIDAIVKQIHPLVAQQSNKDLVLKDHLKGR